MDPSASLLLEKEGYRTQENYNTNSVGSKDQAGISNLGGAI